MMQDAGGLLRGVFLKGSGLEVLWPEALALALTGVAWLTFATARFRKRLDWTNLGSNHPHQDTISRESAGELRRGTDETQIVDANDDV